MRVIRFIILFTAALGQAEEAGPDPEQGRHWPFTPLGQVTPPVVTQTNWVSNPVDAFILSKLEAKGIEPACNSRDEAAFALHVGGHRPEQRRRGLVGAVGTTEPLDCIVRPPARFEQEVDAALLVLTGAPAEA